MHRLLRSACLAAWIGAVAPVWIAVPNIDSLAASASTRERATQQLFQAVHANDLAAVQASIGDGADVEARNRWGMTAADIAIDRGHYRIAHFLVSVRNGRREQEARVEPENPSPPKAPDTPAAAAAPERSAAPAARVRSDRPAPSTAEGLEDVPLAAGAATPVWPAGKPNPFDPSAPAPGSRLVPADGAGH